MVPGVGNEIGLALVKIQISRCFVFIHHRVTEHTEVFIGFFAFRLFTGKQKPATLRGFLLRDVLNRLQNAMQQAKRHSHEGGKIYGIHRIGHDGS
jgi:hypothetical protein